MRRFIVPVLASGVALGGIAAGLWWCHQSAAEVFPEQTNLASKGNTTAVSSKSMIVFYRCRILATEILPGDGILAREIPGKRVKEATGNWTAVEAEADAACSATVTVNKAVVATVSATPGRDSAGNVRLENVSVNCRAGDLVAWLENVREYMSAVQVGKVTTRKTAWGAELTTDNTPDAFTSPRWLAVFSEAYENKGNGYRGEVVVWLDARVMSRAAAGVTHADPTIGDVASIRGFFRPTKEEFFSDEPLTVKMVVHNHGAKEFRFDKGGDYRFGNGRHDRFSVTFGDPNAKYTSCGGGMLGLGVVPARGVYKEVIDLTPWSPSRPDAQGIIRVTCRRTLTTRVATKLLVDCLETQPIDYARKDARAVLIAEMTRLNQRRAGFAEDREKQKEIERVVDLYLQFPQIQSTFECKVNGRVRDRRGGNRNLGTPYNGP